MHVKSLQLCRTLCDQLWGDPVKSTGFPFRKPGLLPAFTSDYLTLDQSFHGSGSPLPHCRDAVSAFLLHPHRVILPDSLIIHRRAGGPECSHNSLAERERDRETSRHLEPSSKGDLLNSLPQRHSFPSKEWTLSYFRLIYNLMIRFFSWRDSLLWTCLGVGVGAWPTRFHVCDHFSHSFRNFSLNVEHTQPLTRRHQ